MNRIFSMKITALCIIRFQNCICLWRLTFGWLMHSFHSSDACFLSSLVNYNRFPPASLIWLPIRIIDLAWYSQGAQSCCELRWGKKKRKKKHFQNQNHSTWKTVHSSWATMTVSLAEWITLCSECSSNIDWRSSLMTQMLLSPFNEI